MPARRVAPATVGGAAPGTRRLSPADALLQASWFGLAGGLLDLAVLVLVKEYWDRHPFYWQGRFFPWAVPTASVAVLMAPGVLVSAAAALRIGSNRVAAWLFATVALWGPLLRLPLAWWAALLLAAGIGRRIGSAVGADPAGFRRMARRSGTVLLVVVATLAAATTGRQRLAEWRAGAALPPPPRGARNVVLLVLDTVRAESLARWARRGVWFDRALAPAPWTYPSHASFFTGHWPHRLGLGYLPILPAATPTLAEALAARGYRTAGFSANTMYCSYETGLDRGFGRFEDYPLNAGTLLASTPIGRWLVRLWVERTDPAGLKWLRFQSRPAPEVHRTFRGWLDERPRDGRPFFAFLNLIDAHEPFLLPEAERSRLGLRPETTESRELLLNYWALDKRGLSARDVARARDAYEECIAYLDREVGTLLEELDRRGVLDDTIVIITSDHGEQFGEHGGFNHGYSLYLQETHVPLLVLGSSIPAGKVVSRPVSLRDLPATVMDLIGAKDGHRFPGRSLAEAWNPEGPSHRPAPLSELVNPLVLNPRHGAPPRLRAFVTSVLDGETHYLRDGADLEELYGLVDDPGESSDLAAEPEGAATLGRMRRVLAEILADDEAVGGQLPSYLGTYRERLRGLLAAPER